MSSTTTSRARWRARKFFCALPTAGWTIASSAASSMDVADLPARASFWRSTPFGPVVPGRKRASIAATNAPPGPAAAGGPRRRRRTRARLRVRTSSPRSICPSRSTRAGPRMKGRRSRRNQALVMRHAVSSAAAASSRPSGGDARRKSSKASAAGPISMSSPSSGIEPARIGRLEEARLERRIDEIIDDRIVRGSGRVDIEAAAGSCLPRLLGVTTGSETGGGSCVRAQHAIALEAEGPASRPIAFSGLRLRIVTGHDHEARASLPNSYRARCCAVRRAGDARRGAPSRSSSASGEQKPTPHRCRCRSAIRARRRTIVFIAPYRPADIAGIVDQIHHRRLPCDAW